MSQSLSPRTIALLLAPMMLLAPTLAGVAWADGGAAQEPTGAGPRFLDTPEPGTGVARVRLAIPWTPALTTSPAPAALGYTSVLLMPIPAIVPDGGLAGMVQGVARCGGFAPGDSPDAGCTALTRSASCANLAATAYCVVENDPFANALRIGVSNGHTPLRVTLDVKRQAEAGTLENAVGLTYRNAAWASDAFAPTTTADLITALPPVAELLLRTAADGEGQEVTRLTTTTDPAHVLYAAGYGKDGDFLGDQAGAQWSVSDPEVVALSATQGASVTLDPRMPGVATLTVEVDGVTARAVVDVAAGVVSSIVVRDSPQGAGAPVERVEMRAEEAKQLFAAGYDADGNFVGDQDAEWSVLPEAAPCGAVTAQNGAAVFEATRAGVRDCRVKAAASDAQGFTGSITVLPGEGLVLTIVDDAGKAVGDATLTTAQELRLNARLRDADGNLAPPADAVHWRVLNGCGVLNATTGTRVTFDATHLTGAVAPGGQCRVVATTVADIAALPDAAPPVSGAVDAPGVASTGVISVTVGAPALVKVRSAAGGAGVEVGSPTWTTDEPQTLVAAGYDSDFNYVGDLADAAWTLSDESVGALSATSGASVTFDPQHPGTATISVTVGGLEDATGTITVLEGELAIILVRDAAANGGDVVHDVQLDTGDALELHAATYDADANFLGDADAATWAVLNGCGTLAARPEGGALFTAGAISHHDCRVTATLDGVEGRTGRLLVGVPSVASIVIRNVTEEDAFTVTRSAGVPIQLFAAGYAADGTSVGNQSRAAWTVVSDGATPCGTVSPPTGGVTTFTPTKTGVAGCKVVATVGDVEGVSSVVSVRPGRTTRVAVEGVPTTLEANAPFPPVTVSVYDEYDNLNTTFHADGGNGQVSFTLSDKVNSPANAKEELPGQYTYTAADAGTHTFTSGLVLRKAGERNLTITALNGSTPLASVVKPVTVTVSSLGEFEFSIPANTVGVAGQPVAAPAPGVITVTAKDAYENVKTDYVGTPAFTSATDGAATLPATLAFDADDAGVVAIPAGSLTFTKAGAMTFTLTDGAIAGTSGTITVQPSAATRLVVTLPGETYDPATGTVTGTPTTVTAGTAFVATIRAVDVYGNVLNGASAAPNKYTGTKNLVFGKADDGWEGTKPNAKGSSAATETARDFGTPTPTAFNSGTGLAAAQVTLYRGMGQVFNVTDPASGLKGESSVVQVKAAAPFRVVILEEGCGTGVTDRACIVASAAETAPWTPKVGEEQRLVAVTADQWDNLVAASTAQWSAPTLSPPIAAVSSKILWTPAGTESGPLSVSLQGHVPTQIEVAPEA